MPKTLVEVMALAPSWAGWLAQDRSGVWWAYEHEPNQGDLGWYENEVGRFVKLADGDLNLEWKTMLRRVG